MDLACFCGYLCVRVDLKKKKYFREREKKIFKNPQVAAMRKKAEALCGWFSRFAHTTHHSFTLL